MSLPAGPGPSETLTRPPRRGRPITLPAVPEYPAILASPLFAPDRRPGPSLSAADAAEPGGGEPGVAASLNGYAAVGAAVGRKLATAVISTPGGGVKTLRVGERVDGWRLAAVDRGRAVFTRGAARATLVVGEPAAVRTEMAAPR
jgi:hypothetical protein